MKQMFISVQWIVQKNQMKILKGMYVYEIMAIGKTVNLREQALIKYLIYDIQDYELQAMLSMQKFNSVMDIICCIKRFEVVKYMKSPTVSQKSSSDGLGLPQL